MSDPKVLRKLVQEVSEQPVPEVDWSRVEQALFDRIEREHVRPAIRRPPAWRPLVAVAAGAAAIAAGAALMVRVQVPQERSVARAEQPVRLQPSQLLASGAIDAATLHNGDRLVADASALTVHHPGHATWILSGSSSVVVERTGPAVMLELQSGMVRVDVVPRGDIESFAVRVGETVVSVHGTVFTVERRGDRALVQVQRGSVAVGPRSRRGQGASWLMVAPAAGSFSLDGARSATFEDLSPVRAQGPVAQVQPQEPAAQEPAIFPSARPDTERNAAEPSGAPQLTPRPSVALPNQPVQQEPAQPAAEPEPAPEPEVPEVLTEATASAQLDSIRARVMDCHRRLAPTASDNVKVTVRSTLTLTIGPEGSMTLGRFDPPLAPEVQACAGSVLVSTRYPKARNPSTLRLRLRID